MPKPLDILALEPFYGGVRRAMLEAIVRHSRHRWTVLKLPPRRMERRLAVAANWFSEQLSRHWVGRVDLLFTSEAMNLASLLRLTPALASHPSVVYFHANQLPDLSKGGGGDSETDLVNLGTAMAATELWFNSSYHKQTFMIQAATLVDRHSELSSRNPIAELTAKTRLMLPPIEWTLVDELRAADGIVRKPRTVFFETRDANMPLLNDALGLLKKFKVEFNAITVGPVDALAPDLQRRTVSEHDPAGQIRGMLEAAVFVSAKTEAASDYQAVRALMAGCRPVLPDSGVYPELLPRDLHASCLYFVDGEGLADSLEGALEITGSAPWKYDKFPDAFKPFDAVPVCKAIDDRLEQLVAERNAKKPKVPRPAPP